MWQRFTERARKAVFYAQEEVRRLGAAHVGSEHLLLGLVRESDNVASKILKDLGVSANSLRSELDKELPRHEAKTSQDMTLTPSAKQMIDASYDEARRLNHDYIGTEHLLLAAIRQRDIAGMVLARLGVELDAARQIVEGLQDAPSEELSHLFKHRIAHVLKNDSFRLDYFVLGFISEESTANFLKALGVDLVPLVECLKNDLGGGGVPRERPSLESVLTLANEEARTSGQELSPIHFIPALMRADKNPIAHYMEQSGVSLDQVRAALKGP
ncbi:MAG: ATP-dependent Clp protease ATP-binding subunit ClpC [Fimbriimonadaceae bacterium]|jgi:ATP-dependent Clp protease ATP-binding subunit ClpA|nr:ATP-dependent Clp protease ATP-binding subunit ClpC [Fimbriimonadaceae bacterium]